MRCHYCDRDNPDSVRFCASCGTDLRSEPVKLDFRKVVRTEETRQIQPRDLSKLLSETFDIYRAHFSPFFVLALIPHLAIAIGFLFPPPVSYSWLIIGMALALVTMGAGVWSVGQHYVDGRVNLVACFQQAMNRSVRLLVASLLFGLILSASAFLTIMLIGFLLVPYLVIIWYFTFHALVIENLTPVEAMVRSKEIVIENWWRVFGIVVVYLLMWPGIPIIVSLTALSVTANSLVASTIVTAVASLLLAPVSVIGGTVFYFDLRARRNVFDVGVLRSDMGY